MAKKAASISPTPEKAKTSRRPKSPKAAKPEIQAQAPENEVGADVIDISDQLTKEQGSDIEEVVATFGPDDGELNEAAPEPAEPVTASEETESTKLICVVEREAITKAVSRISWATGKIGGLSGIKLSLSAQAGQMSGLYLTCCNGESWLTAELGVTGDSEADGWEVVIDAKTFEQLLKARQSKEILIKAVQRERTVLELIERSTTTVVLDSEGELDEIGITMDVSDFPDAPDFETKAEDAADLALVSLSGKAFKDALASTAPALSTDQHRQILTGTLLGVDSTKATFVATDTHRLHVAHYPYAGIAEGTWVLPSYVTTQTAKCSSMIEDEGEVVLRMGGGMVKLEIGNVVGVHPLLTGMYPNWERVVPQEFTKLAQVPSESILPSLKHASVLARQSANRIRLKQENGKLEITSRGENGETVDHFSCDCNADFEIAFNVGYVADAVRSLGDDVFRLEMTENSRPAVLRSQSGEKFAVVMPMALA